MSGTLLTAVPAAGVPFSALPGRIAYTSGQDGLFEIYSAANGGGDVDKLSDAPDAVDVDPSWEPGTNGRIVFARQGKNAETFRLWTMDGNGGNRNELPLNDTSGFSDRQPAWGPGGQIAFTREVRSADTSHIYTTSASGGAVTQLTSTPAPGFDAGPAWSPGGDRIAFVSDRSGGIPQIFTMDASGANQAQVTTEPCFAANPTWHPTDNRIAYERFCPATPTNGWDIVTVDLDAVTTPVLVTNTPENDHQPAWSPAGDELVFTRYGTDGNKKLFTVPHTGGAGTELPGVDTTDAELAADWGANTTARGVERVERTASGGRDTAAPGGGGKGGKKKKGKFGKKKFRVAPGVKFKRLRKSKSDAFLLTVNPDTKATVDVALSNESLAGHERTTRMAKRHKAVAAINGDFGEPSGRPAHTFAEDGLLQQLSFAVAENFAITRDEQTTFIDRPFETVTADEATNDLWRIERWNFGEPAANDIAAFTSVGGSLEVPPANACAARLTPTTGPRWGTAMTGVETTYSVSAVGCSSTPMSLDGGVVLAAQPGSDGAILLNSLTIGETLDITWTLGWAGVADAIGGTPLLVENGQNAVKNCKGSICGKHPRTAIGVTAAGNILMLVLDGRSERSKGVTMKKLANIMVGLGATFALNLDGGGSSTM
ncbi:MAG: phosphodiester glycosidase family protein, partial [Actinomycetota bacterium]|nr:phosphodiester glycosidase family protein [Actinomycetota bacterium]